MFLHSVEIFSSGACSHFRQNLLFDSSNELRHDKNMKCLCCNKSFEEENFLRDQYVTSHGVDENNYFFKKLFTKDRFFAPRKCFRWEHFCLNRRDEKNHNFLVHYQQGGSRPVEDKPIERKYFDENLQRFCINFSQQGDHYDFFDSQELVSDFLTVFENVFILRPNLSRVGLSLLDKCL